MIIAHYVVAGIPEAISLWQWRYYPEGITKNKHYCVMKIPGLSFSLKRAVGISGLKNKIAKKVGIPTTKQGLERKIGGAILKPFTRKKK